MITTDNKSQSFLRITVKLFVFLFLVFLLISWIGAPVFAQTGTQLNLTSKDLFNGDYELHKVLKGETLYGISKKYNASIDVLKLLNPTLETKGLQEGIYLKVPKQSMVVVAPTSNTNLQVTPKPVRNETAPVINNTTNGTVAQYHTVVSGETLYGLSKKFNCTTTQLKDWNKMTSDNVQLGSKIIVGFNTGSAETKSQSTNTVVETNTTVNSGSPKTEDVKSTDQKPMTGNTSSSKKMSVSETGVASFTTSSEKLLLALHPSAPVGTFITVKNPDNGKTIQVKVIGRLPETESNQNVSILLSSYAAAQLGITSNLSDVVLTYLAANQ